VLVIILRKFNLMFILFTIPLAYASAQQAYQNEKSASEDIERVEVLGSKPLSSLLKLRHEKRFAFMHKFNDLIDDEDLHFVCKKQVATGSHIRKEVCKNQFEWRIIREIVDEEVSKGNETGAYAIALMGSQEQTYRKKDLLEKINGLLEKNDDFAKSLQEFNSADEAYKKAHAKKFGVLSQHKN
jgi:hypothetical protein